MAKQKAANQAAKKAASDGKITQKEAERVQSVAIKNQGNAAIAIAKAAANNQAQIAKEVQNYFGLDQTKRGVNYSPSSAPGAEYLNTWNGSSIKPGVAPVTGFVGTQSWSPNGGSANGQAPVYTFFNKKQSGVKTTTTAPAPDPNAGNTGGDQSAMNPQTNEWGDSVDSGLSELEAILKAQMEANAQQTSLYMGMMQDMMSQMQNAQAQAPQGAYATTSYQVAPATGAVQTKEITARKPNANTSLSIGSTPSMGSGVGTQLAI